MVAVYWALPDGGGEWYAARVKGAAKGKMLKVTCPKHMPKHMSNTCLYTRACQKPRC